MINIVRAEWHKLCTTSSFWWTTGIFFVSIIGISASLALVSTAQQEGPEAFGSFVILSVMEVLGFAILMVQAIMMVTTEYRYKLQTITYTAMPVRWKVALVKLVMSMVVSAALVFIALVVAFALSELLLAEELAAAFNPFSDDLRALWAYPLAMALIVMFAQGLSLIIRQTAGTIAISFILLLGMDNLLMFLPKVGDKIVQFSPFGNLTKFLNENVNPDHWWGVTGALIAYVVWAAALWIIGLVLLHKRDV